MENLSSFPQQIDTFTELYDLPPSKAVQARRLQELKKQPSLNATEQAELNGLVLELGNFMITPQTWNKFASALINVETFFTQEVMEFIEAKQVLWNTYVDNFKHVGVYDPSVQYKFQNTVTYKGDLYLAKSDTKNITPTNDKVWTKISSKGDKGDVGLNVYFKGDYKNEETYIVGDAVTFNGNMYYAKETTTGITPEDDTKWFLSEKVVASVEPPANAQQGLLWIEILE